MSGFFLGWYYIPEPGLVIELREEMFNDTRFGAEVYYMHVRGVDTLMVLSYVHILKKIFLKNYVTSESDGWLLGGYAFFFPLYYFFRNFPKCKSLKWSYLNYRS
jgi:quinol-cytochrome oxidoreductase complex cytochrome b subunit